MNNPIYLISQAIIIVLVVGMYQQVDRVLTYALAKSAYTSEITRRVRLILLGVVAAWLVGLAVAGWVGRTVPQTDRPPVILWIFLLPIAIVLGLLLVPAFRRLLGNIPERWLLYGQSFRILTELFLGLGYLGGFVPVQMTFLSLNHDYTVALTAPMAGYVFFGKGRYLRFEGIIWNTFGLALLLNIFWISLASMPSSWQLFQGPPENSFMAHFPFLWIPGFLSPLAFAMHVYSLYQLMANRKPRRQFRLPPRRSI